MTEHPHKLYSIGETSRITGVSIQTLRNYSKDGLLTPDYIDPESGYRYFAFRQFHRIDRIKYLRSLDLPLPEVKKLLSSDTPEDIAQYLEKQSLALEEQILRLQKKKEDLDWYAGYFRYYTEADENRLPHVRHFPARAVLYTDCPLPLDIEATEVALTALKTQYMKKGIRFLRQFGYLLDFSSVLAQKWEPRKHFVYLAQLPEQYDEKQILILPAGDYFCCSFRLHHLEELNIPLLKSYFAGKPAPLFVAANEYEDNLNDYRYCPYELQFPLFS